MKTWKRFYACKSARDKDWLRVIRRNSAILSFCRIFMNLLSNDWITVAEIKGSRSLLLTTSKSPPSPPYDTFSIISSFSVTLYVPLSYKHYTSRNPYQVAIRSRTIPGWYLFLLQLTFCLSISTRVHLSQTGFILFFLPIGWNRRLKLFSP